MRMLVVGGSRFIGLHLVRLLHSNGHQVTVLNRGETEVEFPNGIQRVYADRNDRGQVAAAIGGSSFDHVYDISGYTGAGLRPVLEALDGRLDRYVYCSTTDVYAPSHLSPMRDDFPMDRRPDASAYAAGKVECEDMLMEAHARSGLPVIILRPPYVYGPDNRIRAREASFFARIARGRRVIVPGDGLTLQHFVHVDDLTRAFVAVPLSPHAVGQAYTIGGREAITGKGFVATIAEVMGKPCEVVHLSAEESGDPGTEVYPFEWNDSHVYTIEKVLGDLDWKPEYDMRGGLAMTYRWWVDSGPDLDEWDFSVEDTLLASRS